MRRKSWNIGWGGCHNFTVAFNTLDLCCFHTLYCILFMIFLSVYKVVKQSATTFATRKTPIPSDLTDIQQTIIMSCPPPQTHCVPPASSYLQVGSLQSTVHVLLPRVRQLARLWTGHGVHTSADTQHTVSASRKSKTDWTHCSVLLCASRRLERPRTAPSEASGVVPGHS